MNLQQIKNEIDEFNNKSIEIVPGFDFNQKETINNIILYYNSKYLSGDIDDQGDKKYFYNINRNPCNVATKAIDFDTKDIRLLTAGGGSEIATWLFEKDLKFWMKDQEFGKTLNRLFYELPIFGSVVLKKVNNKLFFVDLRNFVVEQSADSLDKSNYIIEIHNYTPKDFRKIAKEKKWNYVDEVIEKFKNSEDPYIKVYERYGLDDDLTFKRTIIADVGEDIVDERTGEIIEPKQGYILDETGIDDIPYREFHWEKIPGRWLGVGRVEILFDPQIRVNEISNQQVKSSYWSTLRIWQTQDEGISRNLLTDVDNGEILNVEAPINQVDMGDRNLAYYSQEIQRWMTNRDEMTFAYDVVRGERLPSGTPLGSAQLAAGMAGSYFDQIRENIAMAIKSLLYNDVIPEFVKQNNEEHILRIIGEDFEELRTLFIDNRTKEKVIEYITKNGKVPTGDEYDLIKSIVDEEFKNKKEETITIPKGFYQNIKYKIDIEITGEAIDTRIRSANRWAILQAITADPTLLTDPVKKKLLYPIMEDAGLSPMDLPQPQAPTISQIAGRAGGGVSKPAIPVVPVGGATQTRI